MSKKTNHLRLIMAFITIFFIGVMIGIKLEKEGAIATSVQLEEKRPQKIEEVLRFIDAQYLHPTDEADIIQATINRLKDGPLDTITTSKLLKRINEHVDIKPYDR